MDRDSIVNISATEDSQAGTGARRSRNFWRKWLMVMGAVVIGLIAIPSGYAQSSRATVTGTVSDPSGAVIPGAHVTVTNTSTGVKTQGVTNAKGLYVIPYLNPGPYEVGVSANGFQTFERTGITLSVAQQLKLDFTLKVGSVHQTVSVSGAAPLLNTTSAVSGMTISERDIKQLPQADGNPYAFTQLSAGIVYYGSHQFERAVDQDATASIRVNGAPGPNQFTINGVPEDVSTGNYRAAGLNNQSHAQEETNGTANTFEAFIPPKDAVQEFQLESGRFSAQYGHTAGGNVNVVLKSGTNRLHGDLYEFNRNSALFTDTFFAKAAGAPKSQLRYNRYGGSIGGPVYIPKLYNGRNRTFFFFAYQGLKQSSPNPSFYTVPTKAERQGDFSALQSQGVTIYNPYSATTAPNGLVERQPFPNNVIPASYLDTPSGKIAQNILKYYPLPNRTGNQYGQDNFFSQGQNSDNYNSELVDIDETISSRNRISLNWFRNFRKGYSGWSGTINGINPTVRGITRPIEGVGYEQTYTFNPSTVLNVRLGVISRVETHFLGSDGVVTPASLGFPSSTVSLFQGGNFMPEISASDLSSMSNSGPDFQRAMVYSLEPSLMKTIGNHTLHIGFDYRVFRLGSSSDNCIAGCYSFGTNYTSGPYNTSGSEFGQGIAALVLGQPTGGHVNVNGSFNDQLLYDAFYVQDNWVVTPKLTLNAGLRYGTEGAVTERHNENTRGFDFTNPNPIQAQVLANYQANPPIAGGSIQPLPASEFKVLGGVTYANSNHRDIYNADRNNFQPRVGMAYAFNNKMVAHAGWGMFMVPHNFIGLNQPGYNQTTDVVPSTDNGLTFQANLANPFPGGVVAPSGSSLGLKTELGQGVYFYPIDQRNGMAQEWEFDVQRQLGQNWVADIAYVGNHGYDLVTSDQLDALPKKYLSTQATRDTTTINDLSTTEPNPFEGLAPGSGLNGAHTSLSQLLLPYPQFTSIGSNRFDGTSDYNALQVTVKKRFHEGFSLLATYTWSKLESAVILLNPQDTNYTKSVSPSDTPQRFTLSGIWHIPVGHGRAFGSHWGGPLNAALGGWQAQWIYTASSGTPILFENDIYYNGNPDQLRANIKGSTVLTGTFPVKNFYPGGVVDPNSDAIRLSDHYRTFPYILPHFRTQALNNADIELMKRFNTGKHTNVQIQADFLNAFNHPLFGAPDMNPTSGEFSKVTSQENFPRNIQLGAWFNF